MKKARNFLKLFSLPRFLFRKKQVLPSNEIHFEPPQILDRATNDDVFERTRKPLTPQDKRQLQEKWALQKPEERIYEDISDETSQLYAQRLAEQGQIDPRNAAANSGDTFELNQRRRKALRKTIGLSPDRKE